MNMARHAHWFSEQACTVSMYTPPQSPAHQMLLDTPVKLIPYFSHRRADVWAVRKLYRQIKADPPQFLFIHHSRDISLGILLKTFFLPQLKVIYFQEMQIGVDKQDWLHTLQYRRLDAWIAPLPWLRENTLQKTKIDREKVHVVPLGIDLRRFYEIKQSQAEIREALKLPVHAPLIGIVGRYDPHKGQDYLIKAFSQLKPKGFAAHILLLGEETRGQEGSHLPYLKQLCKDLDLEDRVHFRPFLEEVEKAYHALDIFVMATPNETYGMVTIEAMSCGKPVVGSNAGGTREIVKDNETGLLFEPGNVDALAQALEHLLSNPELSKALGRQARQDAYERFNHQAMLERLDLIMDDL